MTEQMIENAAEVQEIAQETADFETAVAAIETEHQEETMTEQAQEIAAETTQETVVEQAETEQTETVAEQTETDRQEEIMQETAVEKVDGRKNNGRKATFADRQAKLAALLAYRDGDGATAANGTIVAALPKTRFLEKKLAEMGLVKPEPQKIEGQKGRPRHVYTLTGQGKSVLTSMLKKAERDASKAEEVKEAVGE